MRDRYNSRRQLVDCLAHRVIEIVQPLPVQSSVEGRTDVGAGQPKFNVVHLIGQIVLDTFQSIIDRQITRRKLTLIVARITLTEPKMALAGVALETSLARFKTSTAAFNAETMPYLSLGRWDSASMVESRSSEERTVQCGGSMRNVRAERQF